MLSTLGKTSSDDIVGFFFLVHTREGLWHFMRIVRGYNSYEMSRTFSCGGVGGDNSHEMSRPFLVEVEGCQRLAVYWNCTKGGKG